MSIFTLSRKGYDPSEVDAYIKKLRTEYETQLLEQKDRIFQLKEELLTAEKALAELSGKEALIAKTLMHAVQKAAEIEAVSRKKCELELEQLRAFHAKWKRYYDAIIKAYPLDENLSAVMSKNARISRIIASSEVDASDIKEFSTGLPVAPEQMFEDESARLSKGGSMDAISRAIDNDEPEERYEKMLRRIGSAMGDKPFDPMSSITSYLEGVEDDSAETPEPESTPKKAATKKTAPKKTNTKTTTATVASSILSAPVSDSGFSYEEAQNPTDSLEDIMKDLGLLDD